MSRPVKCRVCGEYFKRELLEKDVDWVMPSKNYFYHKKCYEEWQKNRKKATIMNNESDEIWKSYIKEYLSKDLKIPCDWKKIESQRKNFLNKGYNNKGIFFALKYYYDVLKGDVSKAEKGIGIVPYVYDDSREYWKTQVIKQKNVLENIEKQYQDRQKRETIVIKKNKQNKKWISQLDKIGGLIDE